MMRLVGAHPPSFNLRLLLHWTGVGGAEMCIGPFLRAENLGPTDEFQGGPGGEPSPLPRRKEGLARSPALVAAKRIQREEP